MESTFLLFSFTDKQGLFVQYISSTLGDKIRIILYSRRLRKIKMKSEELSIPELSQYILLLQEIGYFFTTK